MHTRTDWLLDVGRGVVRTMRASTQRGFYPSPHTRSPNMGNLKLWGLGLVLGGVVFMLAVKAYNFAADKIGAKSAA